MGMTIIEKISPSKGGLRRGSVVDTVVVDVDMNGPDRSVSSPQWGLQTSRINGTPTSWVIMDHAVPARPSRTPPAGERPESSSRNSAYPADFSTWPATHGHGHR